MRLSVTGRLTFVISAVSLALLTPQVSDEVDALADNDFDRVLAAAGSLALTAVSGWVVVCVVLTLLSCRAGLLGQAARSITPAFLRKALFLGVAGALAVGPVAASDSAGTGHRQPLAGAAALDGLRLPDRPVDHVTMTKAPTPAARHRAAGHSHTVSHTVSRGDTLWSIAGKTLGPGANNQSIAREVRRWYAANRSIIGPDPDLIQPGQQLTIPVKDKS